MQMRGRKTENTLVKWQRLCKSKSEGGLGFKDLYAFNLALLAKQGWRLLQQPNSLVARLFKGRYYPNYEFLQAPVKPNSSYCWCSVAASRSIICQGMRWRVVQIHIWGDSWLPRDRFYNVLSPRPVGVHPELMVRSLLLEDDGVRWNSNLVRSWFLEEEAKLILSIPLSLYCPANSLMWAKEPKGLFTTKSAYFVARSCLGVSGDESMGSTINADTRFLWKALWRTKVPGKVKICVWRCLPK